MKLNSVAGFVILLAVATCFAVVDARYPTGPPYCPAKMDIYPCDCRQTYRGLFLNCERVSKEHVEKALATLKGKKVRLEFDRIEFGDIPSDFFSGLNLTEIRFSDCDIRSFGEKPFSGTEDTLLRIEVYSSIKKELGDLKDFPLGHLKHIQFLRMKNNDFTTITNNWFAGGPESIEELNLENNGIEVLEDNAFADLRNIKKIFLNRNKIVDIKRSMLPTYADRLENLQLSNNGIKELPDDIFSEIEGLTTLILDANELTTVSEAVFGKVWDKLHYLHLHDNPIQCDDKVKWIIKKEMLYSLSGMCEGPESLKGRYLRHLRGQDFE